MLGSVLASCSASPIFERVNAKSFPRNARKDVDGELTGQTGQACNENFEATLTLSTAGDAPAALSATFTLRYQRVAQPSACSMSD